VYSKDRTKCFRDFEPKNIDQWCTFLQFLKKNSSTESWLFSYDKRYC